MKHRYNVLILDAQAVQTLIIAQKLHEKGDTIHLICDSKVSYGYNTKYAKYKTVIPYSSLDNKYVEFIIDYIRKYYIDVIFPMTDNSALMVSLNQDILKKYCKFITPEYYVFDTGYDKNKLMKICQTNSFPHPLTIDLESFSNINSISDEIFPALIKPNYTSGGRGMTLVNDLQELISVLPKIKAEFGECHLQQYIPSGGKQLKVQLYLDNSSTLQAASVIDKIRYYPENGGSSCYNVTIKNKNIVDTCSQLLKIIKWKGFADFDLIEDPRDKTMKIMEINPRIPACIKSAINSGIDYANIYVEHSMTGLIPKYEYVPGAKLRHIGFDILWFLYSKKRFSTKPSWFKLFEKNLSFQDFSIIDPLPFFVGTLGNISKQLNANFRHKKSGLRK